MTRRSAFPSRPERVHDLEIAGVTRTYEFYFSAQLLLGLIYGRTSTRIPVTYI
ncbi:MAG: hypothetical protein JKY17_08500 [Magnetovibrio sp.]|nr:hypothetical protein [Magnetovibrio sp.]